MNEYRNRASGVVISEQDLRTAFPNTMFPATISAADLDEIGFDPILQTPAPTAGATQVARKIGIVQDETGNWVYDWVVEDIAPSVLQQEQEEAIAAFKTDVIQRIQQRLDTFAATRGYGDERTSPMVSLCTYIGSAIPKFATEAEYGKTARDATWATLYAIDAAVSAGNRAAPVSYEEIELELPPLQWPDEQVPEKQPA